MKKRIIEVPGAGADLPFSPAVAYGSLLFVSGQVGKDASGQLVDGGFKAQVHQTMENIKSILGQAGSDMDCVLKVQVYLADMDNFSQFNEIYKTYFPGDFPTRTTFQVGRFGPGVQIEIDAIAYIPETSD